MTIFSPIRVGTMPLGHRLVVPPHSEGGRALLGTEERSGLTGGQLAVAALAPDEPPARGPDPVAGAPPAATWRQTIRRPGVSTNGGY
jgi:hypothetical protein